MAAGMDGKVRLFKLFKEEASGDLEQRCKFLEDCIVVLLKHCDDTVDLVKALEAENNKHENGSASKDLVSCFTDWLQQRDKVSKLQARNKELNIELTQVMRDNNCLNNMVEDLREDIVRLKSRKCNSDDAPEQKTVKSEAGPRTSGEVWSNGSESKTRSNRNSTTSGSKRRQQQTLSCTQSKKSRDYYFHSKELLGEKVAPGDNFGSSCNKESSLITIMNGDNTSSAASA